MVLRSPLPASPSTASSTSPSPAPPTTAAAAIHPSAPVPTPSRSSLLSTQRPVRLFAHPLPLSKPAMLPSPPARISPTGSTFPCRTEPPTVPREPIPGPSPSPPIRERDGEGRAHGVELRTARATLGTFSLDALAARHRQYHSHLGESADAQQSHGLVRRGSQLLLGHVQ